MSPGPALAAATATVGPYVVAKLRSLGDRLQQVAPRVVVSAGDADAVHDLRVALRRTRTVLEVVRAVLGRFQVDEVRRAFRDLQRATGVLRDEEVLLKLVHSLGVEHPDAQRWIESRSKRERRMRGALSSEVRNGELERGCNLLGALLAFRVKPSRDRKLVKFALRAVEDARREVERHRAARAEDVEELHRLRIAYKRLRYTVEAFGDVLPSDLAPLAQTAARFQGRLGELHDVDMALASVRRARLMSEDGRRAVVVALLKERESRLAAYAKELGVVSIAPTTPPQEVGTESLRKISNR